jgi:hypothetical protein
VPKTLVRAGGTLGTSSLGRLPEPPSRGKDPIPAKGLEKNGKDPKAWSHSSSAKWFDLIKARLVPIKPCRLLVYFVVFRDI